MAAMSMPGDGGGAPAAGAPPEIDGTGAVWAMYTLGIQSDGE